MKRKQFGTTKNLPKIGVSRANGSGDRDSILGLVIAKTQKMVFDAFLFNTQYYKVRIKGKWSNPGKGVAPFTARCSDY